MLPTAEVIAALTANGRPVTKNTVQHWARRHPILAGRYDKRTYAWNPLAVQLLAQGLTPREVAARLTAADQGEAV